MHISRGCPLISAEHDPHLPALQFHRTARSLACSAWIWCTASRTTMPSDTSVRYSLNSPSLPSVRHISKRTVAIRPLVCTTDVTQISDRHQGLFLIRTPWCVAETPKLCVSTASRQLFAGDPRALESSLFAQGPFALARLFLQGCSPCPMLHLSPDSPRENDLHDFPRVLWPRGR